MNWNLATKHKKSYEDNFWRQKELYWNISLSHPFLSVVKKNLGVPEKNIDSKLK